MGQASYSTPAALGRGEKSAHPRFQHRRQISEAAQYPLGVCAIDLEVTAKLANRTWAVTLPVAEHSRSS